MALPPQIGRHLWMTPLRQIGGLEGVYGQRTISRGRKGASSPSTGKRRHFCHRRKERSIYIPIAVTVAVPVADFGPPKMDLQAFFLPSRPHFEHVAGERPRESPHFFCQSINSFRPSSVPSIARSRAPLPSHYRVLYSPIVA